MGFSMVRLELQSFFVGGHGFPKFALGTQHVPHFIIDFGQIGADRHCLMVTGHCLIEFTLIFQRNAHVVVRFSKVRFDLHSLFVGMDCLIQPALFLQRVPHVIIIDFSLGMKLNRFSDQGCRTVIVLVLSGNDTEQMHCIRVIRILFKYLFIDSLGVVKLPVPVKMNSFLQLILSVKFRLRSNSSWLLRFKAWNLELKTRCLKFRLFQSEF